MSLLDMLQQRLSGQAVDQISRRIGADPGTTNVYAAYAAATGVPPL